MQALSQQREAAQEQERPVLESLAPEQQQAIRDEVQATLQMLVNADMQISGEVSQETLDALAAQGYALQAGIVQRVQQAELPMPDPTITVQEMNEYGYKWDGMLPLQEDVARRLFENEGVEIYRIYEDNTEGAVLNADEITEHAAQGGIFGVEKEAWQRHLEKPQQEQEAAEQTELQPKSTFAIYQIKGGEETRNYRFEPLERLRELGLSVQKDNYDLVYSAPLSDGESLEDIYRRFNIDHPADFTGHSLSVSDIVVLRNGDSETAHYCDSFGFTEVPEFLQQQEQTAQKWNGIDAEITAAVQERQQTEPLPPSLDPAVQPVVTIIWSESDKLQEGEQLPLARADALFKALDEEKRTEREKPGYTGGWYDKTKFRIDCTFDGERDSYEGRQDFGDGDGSLIDHIEAYHEYYANDESWQNYVLHNQGAESWEQDKAEREMILSEFVPYMRLHCNLSEQERTAADVLENGENLTPEQTAYFTAVLAHVDTCREKLNAGDYHLPDPPQFADFAQETAEMEAYKDHVREEIAQEAAAAGMTVEEYAANGYEPREQPIDAPEQPETPAVKYYPINEGAARRANDANSYRDYAAGSATAEYRQMVDEAAELAQRQKERVDPMYHEKIDALLDTYARRLAENMNNSYAIEARVPSILIAGGSNFPVAKKHKQNAARDRNMQEWQDVQGILDKIRSTGMGGISMDDPQAAAKLEAKLDKLVQAQETMKAVNAYYRKHKALDGCPHLTPEQIDKLKAGMAQSWHLDKSRPYQSFVLSNNNAEIRRIRARIEQVRQHEDTQFAGWEFDGGRVEANKADNRLQIFFDGKPDEGTRDELKANGFRWAPSVGAWQRQLNMNAYRAAEHISCIQPVTGDKPVDLQRNAQYQQEAATPDTLMTGERITTPRGSFHVTGMTREQMEAAGYGYHHSSEDGKYLIMGNGTQAYAIAAEQRVPENYMRTAELTTEQNYNMIDGRINNTPSVDELEEKAKRGEVISLSALAAAVKAEDGRTPQRSADGKKPSIRAQLKADRAQAAAKPKQKEKGQEARRSVRQALEME